MNHVFTTLVTNEPPVVKLGGTDSDIPLMQFGGASHTFDVQLLDSMAIEDQAAWCRRFAQQLNGLADLIERTTDLAHAWADRANEGGAE